MRRIGPIASHTEPSESENLPNSLTKTELTRSRKGAKKGRQNLSTVPCNLRQETELAEYKDYCAHCAAATLPPNHPMMNRINRVALEVAGKNGCPQRADSLIQEGWNLLAKGGYKGEGPLDGYIRTTFKRLYTAQLKKGKVNLLDEITDVMIAKASMELPGKVEGRVLSGMLEAELKEKLPELPRTIMQIVVDAEKYIGHEKLAELATERMKSKRPVTRYQVEKSLERIGRLLLLPADFPNNKAKSGRRPSGHEKKAA